jgi:hypothetical protein
VVRGANEVRVGGACGPARMYVGRVGGACGPARMYVGRVGGACGPPPPFVAPLVPRCALTSGATPPRRAGRRLRLGRSRTWLGTGSALARHWLGTGSVLARYWLGTRSVVRIALSTTLKQCRTINARRARTRGANTAHRGGSTSRGVAPEVSAQRGTSGATNGGGGPQAPPTRLSLWLPIRLGDSKRLFQIKGSVLAT